MSALPRRLYAQIILFIAVILAATFISYSLLTSARQSAMLQKAMEENVSAMARNLSESAAHFLVIKDYAGLEEFILRSADLPDIVRIQACEQDGTVIADVAHANASAPAIRFNSPRLLVPEMHEPQIMIERESLVAWHPIMAGNLLGWIKTTSSMQAIAAMREEIWKNTVLLGSLWMLGSFVLLLLFLRPPLTAIGQLSQFARRLNELKGERISVRHVSLEIEQLEESLNYASRELASTEHQLVAERERLAVTLQSIGDGVIAIDIGGKVILMNRVAEHLTGWTATEAEGRPVDEVFRIINGNTRDTVANPLNEVIRHGAATRLSDQTVLIAKSSAERSIAGSGAPIVGKDNAVVGVVLAFRDVTEKRKMREERQKLEDQLRQAQKMEAVGQLAGGIAHDFNNILSAIIGYASLLQMKTPENDPIRSTVDPILESANRAASLTHSLLAFSRKQLVELKPVDINAIIHGIEKILKRLIREDVEFVVHRHATALTVTADKGQLEQVLINLVTNARDAMPRGGKLMISTENISLEKAQGDLAGGAYAVISVSDTGIGMDKSTQEHIFEPFFTTKEIGKGTGLGLSMVYGIVKQHSGAIHVYSEPGLGTTFKIYLPLREQPAGNQAREAHAPLPRGSETILLVEDDTAVREITRIMLEEFGYTVMEAVDGASALALFRLHGDRIQLVLTDIIMPKMDGRSLIKEVQRMRPDMKALLMSGYTADIINEKWPLDGRMNYISKPLNPDQLLGKIRSILASEA